MTDNNTGVITRKKRLIVSVFVLLTILVILIFFIIWQSKKANDKKMEEVRAKVESYSETYWFFAPLEDVEIKTQDGMMTLFISFVPTVGSFPDIEEIYGAVSSHARQVKILFPEIAQYQYTVLWGGYPEQEALTLMLDEEAVRDLETNINQCYEQGISYKEVFSSIVETEESKSWSERVVP